MASLDTALSLPLARLPAVPPMERPRSVPRPLGLWATFGWVAAGIVAIVLLAFLAGFSVALWNVAHGHAPAPGQLEYAGTLAVTLGSLLFVGMIALACRRAGWSAADNLAVTRPHGRYVIHGAVALVVPLAVAFALAACGLSLAGTPTAPTTTASLIFMLFGLVVVAPVWEELVFRGFLYRGLASRLGVAGAIALTSLPWALLHFDKTWVGVGWIFFCGLVWGWLRWRTGSTAVTMTVHALNNSLAGLALAGVTLGWWTS